MLWSIVKFVWWSCVATLCGLLMYAAIVAVTDGNDRVTETHKGGACENLAVRRAKLIQDNPVTGPQWARDLAAACQVYG